MKYVIVLTLLNISLFANITIHQKEFTISKHIKSWIEFKNENLTRQKYDYSCGSASLSTILKYYYGLNVSEQDILNTILKSNVLNTKDYKKFEDSDFSLSFLDLVSFIKSKGFKGLGLALDLEALSKLKAPVILFVKIRKNEHFTIYKSMDKNYVYLADPSFGNIKIRISKFKEMFYQREDLKYPGKILAILPTTTEQKENIKQTFMNIEKSSNFIYENIKDKITLIK